MASNQNSSESVLLPRQSTWRDYLMLCKLKVVALLLITALVGMHLATPGLVPPEIILFALLGIGLVSAGAAVINHVVDEKIDAEMSRTAQRPLPQAAVSSERATVFAIVLSLSGMFILIVFVNLLTAALTFFGLVGYAFIYSMYLKYTTPQNIVIGGLPGALPPLLGWTAVTNSIELEALLLVLLIFFWTPPHFWPLAIDRCNEYKKAKVPMLPVTHGIEYTKTHIVFYTIALLIVSLLPFFLNMTGWLYLWSALSLGMWFLLHVLKLKFRPTSTTARRVFHVSIYYLLYLFVALLADHYLTNLSTLGLLHEIFS